MPCERLRKCEMEYAKPRMDKAYYWRCVACGLAGALVGESSSRLTLPRSLAQLAIILVACTALAKAGHWVIEKIYPTRSV